jgi:hypothetical protein
MPQNEYQRLTRTAARWGFSGARTSHGSLWLGADHLLTLLSTGYTENYKRFYFRDIQAITIQKTRTWQTWNFIWGVAVFIALVGLLAGRPNGSPSSWDGGQIAGGIFLGGLVLLSVVFLLLNLLWGATCKCYSRTAVQIEELPSVRRIRHAQKIVEKIRPLIAAAQGGELNAQVIAEKMREQIPPPAETTGTAAGNPGVMPEGEA